LIGRSIPTIVVLTICLLCGGCQPSDEHVRSFQRALDDFDAAQSSDDFLQCAALYQEIIDSGTISGAILFNQGNAFAKANQKGHAIACYRQAQKYRPSDPYLTASLKNIARQPADNKPIIEYVLFWQDSISYPLKYRLTFFCLVGTVVLALLKTYRALLNSDTENHWPRNIAILFGILTFVSAGSLTYDWYRFDFVRHGVVLESVEARKGNSATYEPAFQSPLEETTEFSVDEIRNEWALIRLHDGNTGWVPAKSIVVY
jgi:hypothetical protein